MYCGSILSGFQKGIGQRLGERVIGGAGKNTQHHQRSSGDRENITVLVTIYGDGTTHPPTVIFKGKEFQVKWKQDNPTEVLGYSKKGYIKGSRVVIFAAFKRNWSDVRDRWERVGKIVDKTIAVYAEAHFKTRTPENIKSAFKKTGVIPLDRNVVTEDMMAPNIESSSRSVLPVQQSSPVKYMSNMIVDYMEYQKLHTLGVHDDSMSSEPTDAVQSEPATLLPPATPFARSAVDSLSGTLPVRHNFSQKTVTCYAELLARPPASAWEQELRDALKRPAQREKEGRDDRDAGCSRSRGNVDEPSAVSCRKQRHGRRRKRGGREWGPRRQSDLHPTHSFECVWTRKEDRRVAREAGELENDAIAERNEEQCFGADKAAWELERANAKAEKRNPAWVKRAGEEITKAHKVGGRR
ncbi:hypothetical protein C8R45DRAFT_1193916 [Mycena sanguinolenta]|nr:hypothetical protein C8R45DRAFT_1193916 [Mycena sanguinolenta]